MIPFNYTEYIIISTLTKCCSFLVSKESTVPDHCRKYSLNDPKDKDFQTKCDHHYFDTCDRCESMSLVLNEISGAVAKMSDNSVLVDTKEELEFTVKKAKQDILA
jgi:hypothetical protein